MKALKKISWGMGLTAVVALVVGFYLVETGISGKIEQVETFHANAKAHYPELLKDLRIVKDARLLENGPRTSDAAVFLKPHISWEGNGRQPIADSAHVLTKALMSAHKNFLSSKKALDEFLSDPQLKQIHVDWISELEKYDHWNLFSDEGLKLDMARASDATSIGRIAILSSMALPDLTELREFALVHLAQQHLKGKTLAGLHAFRHVVEIMNTTGSLVASMQVVAALNIERAFVEHTSAKKSETVPREVTEAYRRTSWGWIAVFTNVWSDPLPPEFEPYLNAKDINCNSAAEFVRANYASYADFFEPRFLFETDFSEPLARVRDLQMRLIKLCGLKELSPLVARPLAGGESSPEAASIDPSNWGGFLRHIPYARRLLGLTFMTIAQPNFMRDYEKK